MDFKDYYKILEVDKNAKQDDIKKSFRKLAKKYHPDANKNNKELENKFKEISEANEVLSDPEKRKKYDELGSSWNRYAQTGGRAEDFNWSDWFSKQNANSNSSNSRRRTGNTFEGFGDIFGGRSGVSDFFEQIFGSSFSRQAQSKAQNGEDINVVLEIKLDEAYKGTQKILNINNQKININIKPGIPDSHILKISGNGAPGINGGESGNLFVRIKIIPHKQVQRVNDGLYVDVTIDLFKAVLGGQSKLKTFGGSLKLEIPPETQPGDTLKISGQGMPKYNKPDEKGDLYIKLQVKLPTNLSDEEKALFKELEKLRNGKS